MDRRVGGYGLFSDFAVVFVRRGIKGKLMRDKKQQPEIVVLKFGSSVLRTEKDLPRAVHEIYRLWRSGAQVLAVVSAFRNITNELLKRAEAVSEQPDASALASLLATGEATASAMLCIALGKAGIPAKVLDPAQAGLRTEGEALDADLLAVDVVRLKRELRQAVVVLPGFVGRCEDGYTTVLGRGGSDFTAVFLATELDGRCVLVKDVDGLYASDPAIPGAHRLRFAETTYETALEIGTKLVQPKAVRHAESRSMRFFVTAIGATDETVVGSHSNRLADSANSTPLRVALLGCGTVGGGVYQRLAALPDLFTVTGVGTRTASRAQAAGVPEELITSDLESLVESDCDVVVELVGGTTYAATLARAALRSGHHVVTANKAMMAVEGEQLLSLAAARGFTLRYSAAVGGALPALERIGRARSDGPIRAFSGVLNGTTNFVLDKLAEGKDFASAVTAAQEAGYAEADPHFDLNGTDAAQKLILLARLAFGICLPFTEVDREGIDQIDPQLIRKAHNEGQTVRLVATCRQEVDGLKASVKPFVLPLSHPFASVNDVENRLIIEPVVGTPYVVSGKGAGRWPTAESVVADLLDIKRELQQAQAIEVFEETAECVA
jgi:homoserine dehydrogenase